MNLRSLIIFLLGGVLCCRNTAKAQLVGDQIFLQGRWLEVGVAPNGCWGNTVTAPASYHTHAGGSTGGYTDPAAGGTAAVGLDFSYDVGHDGWAAGSPTPATNCCFYGPYFLPGTPFDGWSIQMNGVRSDAFYTSGPTGGFATSGGATLTGTNVAYNYFPGNSCGPYPQSTVKGYWAGTYTAGGGTISIRTTNRVDTNGSCDLVNVTIKNTGATTVTGIYYLATGDPDNDQVTPGSFPTNNRISYQNDAQHRVVVGARPPSAHQDAYSGLAAKDCRAKAFIYTSWPPPLVAGNNLDLIYAGTATGLSTTYYTLGNASLNADIAYGLIFKLGDLAPGDSTRCSFAWIFTDSTGVDSAFQAPKLNVNCTLQTATVDTYNVCGLSSVPIAIVNGEWGTTNWVWSPSTGLSTTTGTSVTLDPSALSGEITYTITGQDTSACTNFKFLLTIPACFTVYSNSPDTSRICVDDTLKLYTLGDTTGASFTWRGPGIGGPIRGTNPNIKIPHVTMADTGWYYCIKILGGVPDTERTHVLFKPKPVINASFNSPLCSGRTLVLTSTPDSVGETWSWSGPAGFSSALSDPTRPSAPTTYSGVYTVRATFHGCTDSATVTVVIDSTPAVPTVGSNTPVCSGDTLLLNASDVTPGVSYNWTGPSSFTSTQQNPMIAPAPMSANGTYSVLVTLGICTNTATTNVEIRPTPQPVLGSNSPVCSGMALNLTETDTLTGTTFAWSGPLSFTSLLHNPTINPAITANSGVYSVVVTKNGCSSIVATINVVVDSTPGSPSATSNSPVCEGDTLLLFASSSTSGVNYNWSGPLSFTSTVQNPVFYDAVPGQSGAYTVIIGLGTCTVSATVVTTVEPTPPLVASSNTPVCTGDTLKLFADVGGTGGLYSWIGPYTFSSGAQNPTRDPAVMEYGGVYTVSVMYHGCPNTKTTTVVMNQTPIPPMMATLNYCHGYPATPVQAFGENILWYPSAAPGGTGNPVAPIPPTTNLGSTYYYATQTVNGCESSIDSMLVIVNPSPHILDVTPKALDVCPRETGSFLVVDTETTVRYRWFPKLYLDDSTKAQVNVTPETDIRYAVELTNVYNCKDTAYADVTVRPGAILFLPDSVTIYPGESYQINPQTNCTNFRWTPSGGLSNPYISNPLATPAISTRYIVTGITEFGCKVKDTVLVYLADESEISVPNAFAPGSANNTFMPIKRGIAELRHFRVFDRWGVVVFETKDITQGWDGTYKGTPQPFGVYVYQLEAVTSTGKVITKQGNVTLVR